MTTLSPRGVVFHVAAALLLLLILLLGSLTERVLAVDSRVSSAAVGSESTCALLEWGQIKCFGRATTGRVANGDSYNHVGDVPNEMGDNLTIVDLNFTYVTALAFGIEHGCALSDNGTVKCWGSSSSGKLGLEDYSTIGNEVSDMGANLKAVRLGANHFATAITCGDDHTCVIVNNGSMKCWGSGSNGRLGLGSTTSYGSNINSTGDFLPYVKLGTGKVAKHISAGSDHTCAILSDGTLRCWGLNDYGQVGRNTSGSLGDSALEVGDNLLPVNLGTGRTAKRVAAGAKHTCVLLDDSTVKCFGQNNKGQLGIGSTLSKGLGANDMGDNLPTVFLGSGRTAIAIATGEQVSCAVLDDHSVKCWGDGQYGQLMKGYRNSTGMFPGEMENLTPIYLGSRTYQVLDVYVGKGGSLTGHICIIYSPSLVFPGTLACWGENGYGQLGVGSTVDYGGLAGENGTSFLPANVDFGNVPTFGPTLSPTSILNPSASPSTSAPSFTPTTARPSSMPTRSPSRAPSTVRPTLSPYINDKVLTASLGMRSTCVLLSSSQGIKCFGGGTYGRLASGGTSNIGDDPSEMGVNLRWVDLGFTAVKSISLGVDHACAVSTLGELKCWGYGVSGELGIGKEVVIGDNVDEMGMNMTSVDLGSGRTAVDVSAGDSFTCALLNGGDIKCWGYQGNGRLGRNSTFLSAIGDDAGEMGDNLTSINLGTGKKAVGVSAGGAHACALLSDHTVRCWGDNANGQLGRGQPGNVADAINEMGDNLIPVNVGTGHHVEQIATGDAHTCVLLENGQVKCFGRNNRGQLGIESRVDKGLSALEMGNNLSTVALGPNRTALKIRAGEDVSCAVLDDHSLKCWGSGARGQMLNGSTEDIGATPNSMNGSVINLGARTYQVVDVSLSKGSLYGHTCAILSSTLSLPGLLTCWGSGTQGQLGSGNTAGYGAAVNQTGGDILPTIDLGPFELTSVPTTLRPSVSPTTPTIDLEPHEGTNVPTTPTTFGPSHSPSPEAPTTPRPSVSPTTPTMTTEGGNSNKIPESFGIIVGTSVSFGLIGIAIGGGLLYWTIRNRALNRSNGVRQGEGERMFMMVPILNNKGEA